MYRIELETDRFEVSAEVGPRLTLVELTEFLKAEGSEAELFPTAVRYFTLDGYQAVRRDDDLLQMIVSGIVLRRVR